MATADCYAKSIIVAMMRYDQMGENATEYQGNNSGNHPISVVPVFIHMGFDLSSKLSFQTTKVWNYFCNRVAKFRKIMMLLDLGENND